jgi:uncharacterized membrane protein YagU involved in acid resistance
MTDIRLSAGSGIILGGLVAGVLDIAAVFAFWATNGVSPFTILQSIASARFGAASFDHGTGSALIGLFLHFAVSFVFAAGYVVAASRAPILRARPVVFGLVLGLVAYLVMTFMVVPLSNATFGASWPPPALNLAVSLFIHLALFGLPIALVTSRVIFNDHDGRAGASGRFTFTAAGAVFWGGLIAGIVDLAAVLAIWLANGVAPATILQSIASSVLGREAFQGGAPAAVIGLALHFLVSFVFAAGYVAASARAIVMRFHPVTFGLVYGLVVHWIMSTVVVPLSLADFGSGSEPPGSYARTLFIHMVLFGLPIALAASRIRQNGAASGRATS